MSITSFHWTNIRYLPKILITRRVINIFGIYQLAEMTDKVIDSLVSRIFEVWN
jgi:flagellar biosynthesis protein FliQ